MVDVNELEEQIKIVAEARQRLVGAREAKNKAQIEWENQNKSLLDSYAIYSEQVNASEALLRELTLKAYAETGNKAPAVGVGIREVTKLDYDQKVAFSWATEHRMALKLDTPAFEKIVKASPLDFVTIYQEPQATIATDLSNVLLEVK